MEGETPDFSGTEAAKLVMLLELPVSPEEFLRIADPIKQTLAATAKVASADKVSRLRFRSLRFAPRAEQSVLTPLFRPRVAKA